MPLVSKAQTRAMHAAKEGRSTLGIPKSVGADFVAAGKAKPNLPERKGTKFCEGGPVEAFKDNLTETAANPTGPVGLEKGGEVKPKGRRAGWRRW